MDQIPDLRLRKKKICPPEWESKVMKDQFVESGDRRVVSLDSASFNNPSKCRTVDQKSRSLSAGNPSCSPVANLMVPLSFEEVDLKNTPLSSLRSCSEFQRHLSTTPHSKMSERPVKVSSFAPLKKIFSRMWGKGTTKSKMQGKGLDEKIYFIENMTARGILEGDDVNSSYGQVCRQAGKDSSCFQSACARLESTSSGSHRRSIEEKNMEDREIVKNRRQKLQHDDGIFFSETAATLDVLFGYKSSGQRAGMEIELKTIKCFYTDIRNSGFDRGDILEVSEGRGDIPRSSLTLIDCPRSEPISTSTTVDVDLPVLSHLDQFKWQDTTTWKPVIEKVLNFIIIGCRHWVDAGSGDDALYDLLRLQPFTFGSYLRGMLWAGYSSLFFNGYSLMLWPVLETQSRVHGVLVFVLYFYVWIEFIANTVQLPLRIALHFNCWESSRTIDVNTALTILRNMIRSDVWVVNRCIGRAQDLMAFAVLVAGEIYLHLTPTNDALRSIVLSICATSVFALVVRIIVSTLFSLSCHDPTVLSEARRRGLSSLDIEILPTFVFTNPDEVTNQECSICLCNFDIGEMLTSLPCSQKHSFHSCCIRQWLQRQNSCPLCQKLV